MTASKAEVLTQGVQNACYPAGAQRGRACEAEAGPERPEAKECHGRSGEGAPVLSALI